jgi:hypothetical protein
MLDTEPVTISDRDTQVLTAIAPVPAGVPLSALAAPLPRQLRAVADACRTVERAHAQGIVHGALSASAILVDGLGDVHVVGWADGAEPRADVAALAAIASRIVPELGVAGAGSASELGERVLAYLDSPAPRRVEMIRRSSRAGMIAYIAYLIFGPAFLWLGAGAPGYALALLLLVAGNVTVLWLQGVRGHRERPVIVAAGNILLIALIARVTSPFLLGPGIAAVTTMAIGLTPVYEQGRRLAMLAVAMIAAVLVPYLGEQLGWLAATTTPTRDGFVLAAPGLHLRAGGQTVLMVLFTVSLIAAGAVLAFNLSRAQRAAR